MSSSVATKDETIIDIFDSPNSEKKASSGFSHFIQGTKVWLMAHEDRVKWFEDMRGMLSLVATMISTMTFQAAVNPPNAAPGLSDSIKNQLFSDFVLYNTLSFFTSLIVTLLLVSGIPLKYSLPMWLLSIGLCITLTFLVLAYFRSLVMVKPNVFGLEGRYVIYDVASYIWVALMACLGLFHTIRFSMWLFHACRNELKRFK